MLGTIEIEPNSVCLTTCSELKRPMTAMLSPPVEGAAFYRAPRMRAEVFAGTPTPLIALPAIRAETS